MTTEATADTLPRPEFLALGGFYKSELEPWLESQEGRRRRARLLRWLIIGGGLALLAVWLFYVVSDEWDDFWFFVIIILAIGVVIVGNVPVSRLESDVKKFVMEKLAGFFQFTYEAKPKFDALGLFGDLGLLPRHDSARFEDGLEGEIKGVPFRMVEAHLTERRGTGKNAKTVTVFRGLLVSLPGPPAGDGALAVWRRDEARWTDDEDWREVALGDRAFDKAYAVHAADSATAHQLLDANARRVFTALDQRDDVDNVRLGMRDKRLLIVVERGADSFEVGGMNRSLADPDRVQAMVDLFAFPFDAVDAFKLQPAASATIAGGTAIQGSA